MPSSPVNKYSFPTSKIKIYGDTNAKFPKKKKKIDSSGYQWDLGKPWIMFKWTTRTR